MRKLIFCAGCAAIAVTAFFSQAFALQVVLTADEAALVTDPENSTDQRVLAKYDLPDFLRSSRILHAQLTGNIQAVSAEGQSVLELQAAPLSTDWSPGTVSWMSPWRSAGGDMDLASSRSFFVWSGSAQIRIDVTDVVRQWAGGTRQNLGLMIRSAGLPGGHLSLPSPEDGLVGTSEFPTIKVWYLPAIEQGTD